MVFELLSDNKFSDNFGSFPKCENMWKELDETIVDMFLNMGYKDKFNVAKELLLKGNALKVGVGYIRLKTDLAKCPLCGSSFKEGYGALSIVDNETEICSDCGTREQLERYLGVYER